MQHTTGPGQLMTRTSAAAVALALLGMAAASLMPPVPELSGQTRPATPHHWHR
jgi:hypothetical protein